MVWNRLRVGLLFWRDFPCGSESQASAYNVRNLDGFDPWVRKIPWRRKWQPTSVFMPGESHGWRSLVGYSPWGCKESDIVGLPNCLMYFD